MKKYATDSLVVGFALFSMFFGAGNIIFPPFVGIGAGPDWVIGFIMYYIADVGLALIAIYAMLRANCIDRVEGIMYRLGDIPAKIMMGAAVLCIGPLLAIPRTCAASFEMAAVPLFGLEVASGGINVGMVIFSIVYFAVALLCAMRESALVSIVGKYLTPLLVAGLLLMIFMGVTNPIGPISETAQESQVAWSGILAGYQTLDVLAALVFGLIVVNALKARGHTTDGGKFIAVCMASAVAGVALFVVYGGLCYLGATASTMYDIKTLNQGSVVIDIARMIFGGPGSIVLGIVVSLACLTTAIALIGAAGTFFSSASNGRLSYTAVVVSVTLFSAVFCNIGLSAIIAFAVPILLIIYPAALVVVILSIFDRQISNDNVFKFATLGALAFSVCEVALSYGVNAVDFIKVLPFQAAGFGWVVPAAVMGLIGFFVKGKNSSGDACVS